MKLMDLFDNDSRRTRRMMNEYAQVQKDFTVQVLDTIPSKFTNLQEARKEEDLLHDKKNAFIDQYPEEFNADGLTSEYLNERKRRRTISITAMALEACATGYSLNLMFGVNVVSAIAIGAAMATIAFIGAAAERVASLKLKSKWMWIIFAAYNVLLAAAGVWLGLKAHTDMSFVLLHVLISAFSFSIVLTALRHSDKIDRDKLIRKVNKKYKKLVAMIKESGQKIQKLTEEMRMEMSRMRQMAIKIYGYYEYSGRDMSNLRLNTITALAINQVFREDIIPVAQRPINLTQMPQREMLNGIFREFGNHQADENRIIGSPVRVEPIQREQQRPNEASLRDALPDADNSGINESRSDERREIGGLPESETEL